jgi:hypothetical protein
LDEPISATTNALYQKHKDQIGSAAMSDTLEKTMLFRRIQAQQAIPDPMQDKRELQVVADAIFEKLGSRAPAPGSKENDADYMVRIGEQACCYGPEERKHFDRRKLYGPALAEVVKQDLEIARQEIEHPRYSLKPDELREVKRSDASGREFSEFYSDEATGVKPWFEQFKEPVIKYVSGGSAGIATPDAPPSSKYSFDKAQILPELVALQRRAAYADSAEGKLIAAYAAVGKVPPDEVLAKVRK